jgi:hypothetical protein
VEALVHSLGDSIKALDLWYCTLTGSFWRLLAQHLPNLQHLTLGDGVPTSVSDLSFFLGMRSQSQSGSFTIKIHEEALGDTGFAELQVHIASSQLQNVRLLRYWHARSTVVAGPGCTDTLH